MRRWIVVVDAAHTGRYSDFAFAIEFDDNCWRLSYTDGNSDFVGQSRACGLSDVL